MLEEFLQPLELTQYRLAKALKVPARRINELVRGYRAAIGTVLRQLTRFWLNLQAAYDLDVERDRLGSTLERDVEVLPKAG